MNYSTAARLNEVFTLDKSFNIMLGDVELTDSLAKGYIYANKFFFDEVEKEIGKLRALVEKIHDEVILELSYCRNDTPKLLLEMSTRAHRAIGDDGLDCIIKEFLSERQKHIALMIDERERAKFVQICEAIFLELTTAFYTVTLNAACDLENGVKMFKFTREYIALMTDRQRNLVIPALRVIGLENQIKLNNLQISADFTVKYVPEPLREPFTKQEDTIKENIKTFIQGNAT